MYKFPKAVDIGNSVTNSGLYVVQSLPLFKIKVNFMKVTCTENAF